jgi:hypothetical protein
MNWTIKASLFRIIDVLPFGASIHYLLQRHVTHSLPRRLVDYPRYLRESLDHWEILKQHVGAGDKLYFEFGAGWDLFHNMVLYCFGIQRQLIVDLNDHMRPGIVNSVIRHFQVSPPAGALRLPEQLLSTDPRAQLQAYYGITYLAPSDARAVRRESGSVGLVSTTNTLEHIPFDDLARIMREVRRLCGPDAVVSMKIDYSDHYAHADPEISPYNFLRFSEAQWARYNTRSHYQNRRRHSHYRQLFLNCGFHIETERHTRPTDWRRMLEGVKVHPDFQHHGPQELAITSGQFVLRPT